MYIYPKGFMPESVLILFGFLALCVRKNRLTVKYTGEQIDEIRQIFKSIQMIKRRTVANEACDAGRVLVNDKTGQGVCKSKTKEIS